MSPSSPQLKFPGLRAALKMIMKIYVGILKRIIHFKILQELPMLSFTSHCKVRFKCQSCSSYLSCFFLSPLHLMSFMFLVYPPCILPLLSFSSTQYLHYLNIALSDHINAEIVKLGQKSEIWKNLTNLAKMIFQNHGTAWLVLDCVE